jgi:hypothetical protein
LIFGSNYQPGDLKIDDTMYGVYWRSTGIIHRSGMEYSEACEWIEEAQVDFPLVDVHDIWGVWQAQINHIS